MKELLLSTVENLTKRVNYTTGDKNKSYGNRNNKINIMRLLNEIKPGENNMLY